MRFYGKASPAIESRRFPLRLGRTLCRFHHSPNGLCQAEIYGVGGGSFTYSHAAATIHTGMMIDHVNIVRRVLNALHRAAPVTISASRASPSFNCGPRPEDGAVNRSGEPVVQGMLCRRLPWWMRQACLRKGIPPEAANIDLPHGVAAQSDLSAIVRRPDRQILISDCTGGHRIQSDRVGGCQQETYGTHRTDPADRQPAAPA